MEENKQHFWLIMHFLEKGKNATELKERIVQCIES